MAYLDQHAEWLLRLGLVALFPFSALDKVVNWQSALAQARGGVLPGAPFLVVLGAVIEVVCPACILLRWYDQPAAFVLAGFCVVTALLYHPFWIDVEFWRFRSGPALSHFWDFLKNIGLAAGLGYVLLAARVAPVSCVAAHPAGPADACAATLR